MHISFKNIQNDIKITKNQTNTIYHRQSLMLKMVTSYSIFLFIILLLCVYLYMSDTRASRRLYNLQTKATLMSNVEIQRWIMRCWSLEIPSHLLLLPMCIHRFFFL